MNEPLGQLVVLAVRGARCRFATEDLVGGGGSEEEPSPPQQRDDGQRTMQSKWDSLVRSPAATERHADVACARRRKPPGGRLSDPPAPCELLEVAKQMVFNCFCHTLKLTLWWLQELTYYGAG